MRGHNSCSRYKMRRQMSDPCSPYKMPKHRLCKMPRCKMPRHKMPGHRLRKMTRKRFDPRKGPDTSGTCEMREQRSGPCNVPERGSGGSKLHGNRPGPQQMPQTDPRKMPNRRRSGKTSVCRTNLEREYGIGPPELVIGRRVARTRATTIRRWGNGPPRSAF